MGTNTKSKPSKDAPVRPVDDSSTSTVEEVINQPEMVTAFGRKYEIKRFSVGQLIRSLPYFSPISYLLVSGQGLDVATITARLLAVAGEPALGLISVAISEPTEWIEEQDDAVGALELLTAVVEKNARYFFDPANAHRLKEAFDKLQSVTQKHGGATSTS